jgi:quinol monooxygenase YgiN
MSRVSIWAQLEAKPGKEKELEEFLKSAQPLAQREPGTISWYAIKMGPGKYGIFDTFADENGRNAHLNGEIAKALFAKAGDLLAAARNFQARDSCREVLRTFGFRMSTALWAAGRQRRAALPGLPCSQDLSVLCWA